MRSSSAPQRLHGKVPPNAVVAVTVEHARGAHAPTTTPIFSAPT